MVANVEIKEVLASLWGADFLKADLKNELICPVQLGAILLSTNENNFLRYEKMQNFIKIFANLGLEVNKYNIQTAQAGILNAVLKLKIRRDELLLNLFKLYEQKLLQKHYFDILDNFLSSLSLDSVVFENKAQENFHKSLDNLNSFCDELEKFCDEELKNRLKNAKNSANLANFNIALCGVINAGKSSLLNAIIQNDLLGVSNVPQTASICVLKYANKPFAKVDFWDKTELENMGLEARNLESKFIEINELKEYSSANNELAKYIKECFLGLNAEILKDINIIDTPGIDDAVQAREELSAKYLQNCDAMLYLMNSAQAASAKDIEFMKNILTNTKNSEIIVLLTHIDRLKQNERTSVLEYTQKSLKRELGSDLDIKYFLTSATKNIGINELKAYLLQSFFEGSSKKANLILENYKKELSFILDILYEKFDEILRSLGLKSTEILAKFKELEEENQKLNEKLNNANSQIDKVLFNLQNEKMDLNNDIFAISSKCADRVISDLAYAKSKKQKADFTRLFEITNSSLKDFSIDLLRSKKQELEKKLSHFALNLKEILSGFDFSMPEFKDYLDNAKFGLNFNILQNSLQSIFVSSANLEEKSVQIKQILQVFLKKQDLNNHINKLLLESTKDFKANLQESFDKLKLNFEENKKSMQTALQSVNDDKISTNSKKEQTLQALNKITSLKQRLNQC